MVFIRIFLFLFTVNRFVLFLRLWNLIIRKSCPNNLNYITTKFTKTFCNHFLNQKSKTPSHWYLLGRTSGGFCDADLYFVVIINLSSLVDVFYFVVVSSFDFQATLPCHRHSTLVSQAHDGLQQLWALPRLLLIASFFSSTASATVLSGHFLSTGVFYLTLLPDILAQPAFIKVSLGDSSYFLEICRASYWSSKHRTGPSVCLIHINPQSSIHLKFVFMHVNIAKVFTCGENFDKKYRSAVKVISNHENIKQQPN